MMKTLTISQADSGLFVAGSSESIDELQNLSGDIFDVWSQASQLLKSDSENGIQFQFEGLQYSCSDYDADWNDDLVGYVIVFKDGKSAQTQTYVESNKLHADFNDEYLERYTEYDDELSEDQDTMVEEFVGQVNKIKAHYA